MLVIFPTVLERVEDCPEQTGALEANLLLWKMMDWLACVFSVNNGLWLIDG